MKVRRSTLLYAAVVSVAIALVGWMTSRLWDHARRLDLLSSLPVRGCRLYDSRAQRIRLPIKTDESSDMLVLRCFLGLACTPQMESASVTGDSGRTALKALVDLGGLKRMDMIYVPIDESVIVDLERLKQLTRLQLICCNVSDEEVRVLRDRLPGCTVQTDSDLQPKTDEQRLKMERLLRFAR